MTTPSGVSRTQTKGGLVTNSFHKGSVTARSNPHGQSRGALDNGDGDEDMTEEELKARSLADMLGIATHMSNFQVLKEALVPVPPPDDRPAPRTHAFGQV